MSSWICRPRVKVSLDTGRRVTTNLKLLGTTWRAANTKYDISGSAFAGMRVCVCVWRGKRVGAFLATPNFFCACKENRGAHRRETWYSLWYINFASCVKILTPSHLRSGHQGRASKVTMPLKTLWLCHSYSLHPRSLKLELLLEEISMTNSYTYLKVFTSVT